MTVAELRKALENAPQEAPVLMADGLDIKRVIVLDMPRLKHSDECNRLNDYSARELCICDAPAVILTDVNAADEEE